MVLIDRSERIIVALDRSPFLENLPLLDILAGKAKWVKIGLRGILSEGPGILSIPNDLGYKIFLDLKLHDIPSTVASALKNMIPYGIDMVTIHTMGGRNMIKACREVIDSCGQTRKPLLMGVTVLTSLDQTDIRDMGVMYSVAGHVKRLAEMAQQSGCDGVIASGGEVKVIRNACGESFRIVTPGIRPGGTDDVFSDQRRVMSPSEAIELGSDQLVVGRPIHGAKDPGQAYDDILAEVENAGKA